MWENVITKYERYYKVRKNLLQSTTGINSVARRYYKVWQVLQTVIITNWDVTSSTVPTGQLPEFDAVEVPLVIVSFSCSK